MMTLRDDALRAFMLDGQIAAVTGGAKGIGRAIAELFAAAGAKVVILDRDGEAAASTAAEIGQGAVGRRLDVTVEAEVDAVFAAIGAEHGRVDVLVNNAGTAIR